MKQPRALSLLFFVQMWECFSFYGMRALLVLYMIEGLALSQGEAFGVYAVYTAMVEMCVLFGGFLADKVWGLRRSILFGGILIACGHLCLALVDFFSGLALIIVGSSLFKTNVKALLGLFYEQNDPRREAGFTFFYSGMNLGGFLATLLCGYIGHYYGWHAGFGLAAIGMVAGLLLLICRRSCLEDKGHPVTRRPVSIQLIALAGVVAAVPLCSFILQHNTFALSTLPLIGVGALAYLAFQLKTLSPEQKKFLYSLLGMIALLAVYFTFEELMGSLLMVFSHNYIAKTMLGWEIPSSVLLVMNPLTIILMGPLVAKMVSRTPLKKLSCAFCCLAIAFALLYVGTAKSNISPLFLGGSFSAIAFGELLIVPTIYAYCSRSAPSQLKGMMMGLVTMGFAYGSLLSGTLSQQIAPQTLGEYGSFFFYAALTAGGVALVLGLRFFSKFDLSFSRFLLK